MSSDSEALNMLLEQFVRDLPYGDAMLAKLEADQFVVTHASRMAQNAWLLRAKPPRHVEESFGLAPEILLVAVHGEVQARDLHPLKDRLDRLPGHGQRVAWVWGDDDAWPKLSEVVRRELPTFDVFEERDPVRGNQFMGRNEEVATLTRRVARGDAVGVFGLRKVGKTSVVRAVTWHPLLEEPARELGG